MVPFDVIRLSQTDCYLLKAKDGYLLIDCGNSGDQQAFLKWLHQRGIALADIHYLLLTHHHTDHCGLMAFLIAANPQMRVIMSSVCAGYLKTGHHFQHPHEHYANPVLGLILKTFFKLNGNVTDCFTPYFCRPGDILIEGDNATLLVELGLNGTILLTPGHTEDSISIVTDTLAFVGDAARNILNFTGTPYQPLLLYNLEVCYSSWNKLHAEGVKTIFPAHGKPFQLEKLFPCSKRT